MLHSKKKTDGVNPQERIRLIPSKKLAKSAAVIQPQSKPNPQPTVTAQKVATEQTQPKQEVKPQQPASQPTNLVNMLLSQSSANVSQPVAAKSPIPENPPVEKTPIVEKVQPVDTATTLQKIPVSNEEKYEEIVKQNPFVKKLKDKFDLKV